MIGFLVGVAILGGLMVLFHINAAILLLFFLVFGPPVLLLTIAVKTVRAFRDLVRQPHARSALNISVAVAGLITLVLGGWIWSWVVWHLIGAAMFFGGHS